MNSPHAPGNKQLKNAVFRSAWIASCRHPASKAYYQKKRAQGKKHNAARHLPGPAPLRRHLLHAQTGPLYDEKRAQAA